MITQILFWHHGTCRICKKTHTLILMFGYNEQKKGCYCICVDCLFINLQYILYGKDHYKDGQVSIEELDEHALPIQGDDLDYEQKVTK